MISDYGHIVQGLPVMFLLVIVAMAVVIGAMVMDAVYGWRKASERGEAKTSYLFSRSINKFVLYEGVLFICAGMDTLIHFVWAQFNTSTVHCVPLITILGAVVLCVVEIWSMHEKAEEKTRHNLTHAMQVVADVMSKEQVVEIAKHIIDKASASSSGEEV